MVLDKNKICFITCVNNEALYRKCLHFLSLLATPPEMTVEYRAVRGAASMCAGYNQAQRESDAKYKIYLHQDVLLFYPYFMQRILRLFAEQDIGLIGLIGAQNLPESGCWWESRYPYGRVIDSHRGFLSELNHPPPPPHTHTHTEKYREVIVVDGLLMATQYDLFWREDLFQDWHFYDASQCLEFYKAGYRTVVPAQLCSWALHECGVPSLAHYAEQSRIFQTVYAPEISRQRREFEARQG
ncbi:MAG: glycosyltransferase family protein [Candidatus Margulisbacteria bacterium]|jgi:hypothetical protein|nr:glycosyltransferase family protein [Candidatus Margulisiibacteriota bacterium]